MSALNPSSITEWLLNIPIPWLFAGPNGKAEWTGWGSILDFQTSLLRTAVKTRMPDYAVSGALPHIGGDRLLVQGPGESDSNFQIRLKTAWDDWARAGTPLELLVQLYWGGWTGAVVVQQNGLAFTLSGAPTAGVDPTSLLLTTNCSSLSVALTSNVTPPTQTSAGRSIPAGNQWWQFAESRSANPNVSDTDYCNRFAILFPGPLPSQFMTVGTATFSASSSAVVTWNNAFPTTSYHVQVGAVTITDGGGPVSVVADSTSRTLTTVTCNASAAFSGSAPVLAWQDGANPYADLHPADLARLQFIVKTWRPNALCVGVYAVAQGKFMGWPVQQQGSNTMGPWSIARFEGVSGGL